jgi:hypothetical protein
VIIFLLLRWAGGAAGNLSGWELWTMADVFVPIVGLVAIGAATGRALRALSPRHIP